MFEDFTDELRKIMQAANREAERFYHEYIGTEHLLLGLVKESSSVGANMLKHLDVDLRKVRLEVEKLIKAAPEMVMMGKLPQTPRTKSVIENAREDARNLKQDFVGSEHLLLGLMREHHGVAAQVLRKLGVTVEVLRDELLNAYRRPEDNKDGAPRTAPEREQGSTVGAAERKRRLVLKVTVPPMPDTPENRAAFREHLKRIIVAANEVHISNGGSGLTVGDVKAWVAQGAGVPTGGGQ